MKTAPILKEMTVEGIVLSARDIGHANKVLVILTKEHGIIEAFSNGCKNPKSKLVAVSQPLIYAKFVLSVKGGKYTVASADLIRVFYNIRDNVDKLSLSFYLAEITLHISPRQESGAFFLKLLLNTLHFLENDLKNYLLIKAVYELRLLSISGYMPNLICCEGCGVYDDAKMVFYPRSGHIRCMDCATKSGGSEPKIPMTEGAFLAMRHIIYSDLENFFSFNLKGESLKCLSYVCEEYVFEQTERTYQTLDFYKTISGFVV